MYVQVPSPVDADWQRTTCRSLGLRCCGSNDVALGGPDICVAHGVSRSINFSQYFFLLLHCVPLYVCRLCINFQELCARLLGMATLRIRFSPSFHALLIDFLSIRKVIIFSAIATDDRHPLRSRSIYQNAANCMTIRFRYIAQPRGVRKTYCARSRK